MPEPTMGEMARWTYYQRFIAERTRDIDPRHVEAWMRTSTRRSTACPPSSSPTRCTRRSAPPSTPDPRQSEALAASFGL